MNMFLESREFLLAKLENLPIPHDIMVTGLSWFAFTKTYAKEYLSPGIIGYEIVKHADDWDFRMWFTKEVKEFPSRFGFEVRVIHSEKTDRVMVIFSETDGFDLFKKIFFP